MRGNSFAVLALGMLVLAGCSSAPKAQAPPPQIPKITAPTTPSRTPVMVDRALPDDCELVVTAERMNQVLGQELPGEPKLIIGIPEPSVGKTAKIDCYYGIPPGKELQANAVVVGLSTYVDELTARERVTESLEAERQDGSSVTEIDVGKQKASMVSGKDQRLLLGSLGKTTFVVRARPGLLPDDKLPAVLATLAQQAMTPPV
ncbi:hypothetical protein Lesp02_16640 [Lentzea sp. NBRC 105346]|uniref:hypothetical protein n=1 Tax=Lentzea sp. NBRC 105346 TaxID=3032205 RepID=UPI0024A21D86|nr:hypothetical protein [Lentzea sp. NBRC 105346]GLZ29474.1 hypothetical protein Lesp02_16640 [Lentzea sp. NBRC 105346]